MARQPLLPLATGCWMAALLASTAFAGMAADARASGTVAFVGATVLDGNGHSPLRDTVVVVARERIAAVSRRHDARIPRHARIIDSTGKWMVPGLIDAHVHLFQSAGLYTRPDIIDLRKLRPYTDEIAWVRQRLPFTLTRYLASGVTSVVDLGGPFWTFDARDMARWLPTAPRVAVTGPLLATYAPEELGAADPPLLAFGSAATARLATHRVLAHHPDLVKIWFIRRLGWRLSDQTAAVRTIIEESHAAGVRVAVHATELETARAAVQAGADILGHSVSDKPVDQGLLDLLKQRDVIYIPTLLVMDRYREVLQNRLELTDVERQRGDPEVIATLGDAKHLPFWKKPWGMAWPESRILYQNLKRMRDGRIRIAAGTDAGNIGTLHGPSLHRELELMADAGLSPSDIVTACTRNGAEVMGRSGEMGTIEPGKLADFLLLDADPLLDIRNLRRIHRVVKGGNIFDPEMLARQNSALAR